MWVRSWGFLEGLGGFVVWFLVNVPGIGRVRNSIFLDFGLGSTHFWPKRFDVRTFRRGLNGFEVRFWFDAPGF